MKKKIVCFAMVFLTLCSMFCFTSCCSSSATAEDDTYSEPVWHITVYSQETWEYGKKRKKYSIETNSLDTVFVPPYCEYGMLTIKNSSEIVEIVHVSYVEIEYY